jgi:hypothetical protein
MENTFELFFGLKLKSVKNNQWHNKHLNYRMEAKIIPYSRKRRN